MITVHLEGIISTAISGDGISGETGNSLGTRLVSGFLFTLAVAIWNGYLILKHLRKVA